MKNFEEFAIDGENVKGGIGGVLGLGAGLTTPKITAKLPSICLPAIGVGANTHVGTHLGGAGLGVGVSIPSVGVSLPTVTVPSVSVGTNLGAGLGLGLGKC